MLLLIATLFLWADPGPVSVRDLSRPARGVEGPAFPLKFLEEDKSGTSAKVLARDSAGIVWQLKGGPEARAEAFATRLVSALGYYADSVIFVAKGTLDNTPVLRGRAAGFIDREGTFTWAGLERRDPGAKFLAGKTWKWTDDHSKQAHGLRILIMLLANWDNKDARNYVMGPNTGFIQTADGTHAYVTDWGQSMGSWGRIVGRSNWNCEAFRRQTPEFVLGVRNGRVQFGYVGQHTSGFRDGITVEDVRWLLQYLGQVTDAQLRAALLASGASREEETCFTESLRKRIEALQRVVALR